MKLYRAINPSTGPELPAITVGYSSATGTLTLEIAESEDINVLIPRTAEPVTVNLPELLQAPGTKDCTTYLVMADGTLVNVFASTYISKQSPSDFLAMTRERTGKEGFLYISVPDASDINTVSLRLVVEEGRSATITGDLSVEDRAFTRLIDDFPAVSFGAPTASDGVVSVPVTNPANVGVYFESAIGAVLTPYIKGSGVVLVDVSRIPQGVTGNLKANFKYWSNVASTPITT